MTEFKIPLSTNTYTDALVLTGFASLIKELGERYGYSQPPTMEVFDGYACVSHPISLEEIKTVKPEPGFNYFKTKGDTSSNEIGIYDYEEYKKRYDEAKQVRRQIDQLKKRRSALTEKKQKSSKDASIHQESALQEIDRQLEELQSQSAYPDSWFIFQQINVMQADGVLNKIWTYVQLIESLDLSSLVNEAKWPETPLPQGICQLLLPVSGKGVNYSKGIYKDPSSLADRHSPGFMVWMAIRGLWQCSGVNVVGDDLKVYALLPKRIQPLSLAGIRKQIANDVKTWSPVKSDIEYIILTIKTLAKHLMEKKSAGDPFFQNLGLSYPNDIIQGIMTSWFKSLGNGKALGKIQFLSLPNWYPIETDADNDMWQAAMDQHLQISRGLDESRSEEFTLLVEQREAITQNTFNTLLHYYAQYGCALIGELSSGKRTYWRIFNQTTIKESLMALTQQEGNHEIREVIHDASVQAFANAIRQSVLYPLRFSDKGGMEPFYGLVQEWKRKSKFKDQFVIELSDFVSRFNLSVQKLEGQKKPHPPYIREEDTKRVIECIDIYGSELMAHLLLALGTSLPKKDAEKQSADAADSETNDE